jgi:hypothetical protein
MNPAGTPISAVADHPEGGVPWLEPQDTQPTANASTTTRASPENNKDAFFILISSYIAYLELTDITISLQG